MIKPVRVIKVFYNVAQPEQEALRFGAILGADFGYSNEVVKIDCAGEGWRMICEMPDEVRFVDFMANGDDVWDAQANSASWTDCSCK